MQDQINQLAARITALENKSQQINYPLDTTSKTIIFDAISDDVRKLAIDLINELVVLGPFTAGAPVTNGYVLLTVNGATYKIMTTA